MKRILSFRQFCLSVLLFVLSLRLVALALLPLGDKTEARYGEIARLMLQTGNWVTPQIDVGVPFWGKPPLSTWLSACSFKLFGINEFAARLPSFALGLAVLWLTYRLASRYQGRDCGLRAILILAITPVFFVSSGAVMTDPALLLGSTLAMTSFGLAINQQSGRSVWGYLFFIGLAIGLLAKGPVVLVMTGLPIFLWILWQRNWSQVWRQLPWGAGLLLVIVLSVPWYLLAEYKTPGFLDYFLLGEHWKRFMVHGWKGDLYGSAHAMPRGTIWLYWLLAACPWSFAGLYAVCRKQAREQLKAFWREKKGWNAYLLLWAVTPMLFFSLAGNILWTYVLPGLPAFAILLAGIFQSHQENIPAAAERTRRQFSVLGLGMAALYSIALIIVCVAPVSDRISQKKLISEYQALRAGGSEGLVYLFEKPYSADFYSNGGAYLSKDLAAIAHSQSKGQRDFFVARNVERLPPPFLAQVDTLKKYGDYSLLRRKSPER